MTLSAASAGERHNIRATALEALVKDAIGAGNEFLQRMRGKGDFAAPPGRNEENKLASEFNGWRLFRKITSSNVVHKSLTPSPITTERFGTAPKNSRTGNRPISVNVPFLPTALLTGRTVAISPTQLTGAAA